MYGIIETGEKSSPKEKVMIHMANEENLVFSKRLKETRQSSGMSQADLAERANVTSATISAYESTGKSPSVNIAMRIAQALDVSLDWLCGNERYEAGGFNSFALLKVLKELRPKVKFEEHTENSSTHMVAKLIFDDGLFDDGIIDDDGDEIYFVNFVPGKIKAFLNEYLTIRAVEKQLPGEMIKTLENQLIVKYKQLTELPDYPLLEEK